MWYHLQPGFWEQVTSTGWWQLVIVFFTALLTQLFGQKFLEDRKKRQKIVEIASSAISSAREIRSELSSYKQHEIGFNESQHFLNISLHKKDGRIFDYHKQTVVISHDDMSVSQKAYETARTKFTEAIYLLRNMCYQRLGEDKEFNQAANGVLGIKISTTTYKEIEKLKKDIDKYLLPHIQVIESKCAREIYLQTRNWRQKFNDELGDQSERA